jgi:esterase FrsA
VAEGFAVLGHGALPLPSHRRSATTPVAVHVRRRPRPGVFGPGLLLLCGGMDTWKIELHRAALVAALLTGMTVAVVNIPGTGESTIPLAPDAEEVLAGSSPRSPSESAPGAPQR